MGQKSLKTLKNGSKLLTGKGKKKNAVIFPFPFAL